MDIRTKRWDELRSPADGTRILVCRYRPRALPKSKETWDEWLPDAGPSKELHAAYWGKTGEPIPWDEYARRYRAEMKQRDFIVEKLFLHARRGRITLLCSAACMDPRRCHRTLLKELIERRA